MKKTTLFVMLCFSIVLQSQIELSQNFDDGMQGWTSNEFFTGPIQPCSVTSIRCNLFNGAQNGILLSPNIAGMSNGNNLSLQFDYKIVEWGFATDPTPPGWGNFALEFSTNNGSTWSPITTIDDSNHTASGTCVTKEFILSGNNIPSGSDFRMRFVANWEEGDYYLYIDDIVISQEAQSNAPENDDVANATLLSVGELYDDYAVDGTVIGASMDQLANSCADDGPGVWYTFMAPESGTATVETATDQATNTPGFDSVIEVFRGNLGSLVSIDCNDDSNNTEPFYSQINLIGLTPGEQIYFRVWENGGDEMEPFSVSVYNESLSLQDNIKSKVQYFPNPTSDFLKLSSEQIIDSIKVFNLLGQAVISVRPNSIDSELDTSGLQSGSYLVRVIINDGIETFKILKQ